MSSKKSAAKSPPIAEETKTEAGSMDPAPTSPGTATPTAASGSAMTAGQKWTEVSMNLTTSDLASLSTSELRTQKTAEKMKVKEFSVLRLKTIQTSPSSVVFAIDEAEVLTIAESMRYDSFDPIWMRARFLTETKASASKVMNLALATIFFGNNPYERVKKAIGADQLDQIVSDMRSMNIVKTKINSDSLTLARFGQSHPLLILKVRSFLNRRGSLPSSSVIMETQVNPVLQDLSLSPFSDIFPDIQIFIAAFSKALHEHHKRTVKGSPMSLEEWQQNQEKYRQLAVSSFKQDPVFGGFGAEQINGISLKQTLYAYGYE